MTLIENYISSYPVIGFSACSLFLLVLILFDDTFLKCKQDIKMISPYFTLPPPPPHPPFSLQIPTQAYYWTYSFTSSMFGVNNNNNQKHQMISWFIYDIVREIILISCLLFKNVSSNKIKTSKKNCMQKNLLLDMN